MNAQSILYKSKTNSKTELFLSTHLCSKQKEMENIDRNQIDIVKASHDDDVDHVRANSMKSAKFVMTNGSRFKENNACDCKKGTVVQLENGVGKVSFSKFYSITHVLLYSNKRVFANEIFFV